MELRSWMKPRQPLSLSAKLPWLPCERRRGAKMAEPRAGPELDALVAEKVVEWKAKIFSAPDVSDPLRCHVRDEDDEWQLFQPSTDISAAWEVLARLLERDYWQARLENDGGTWVCTIKDDPLRILGEGRAETGPLAICRAALAAVDAD